MSVCRQCDSALRQNERFCGECGTPVPDSSTAGSPAPAAVPPDESPPVPPAEPPPPTGRPVSAAEFAGVAATEAHAANTNRTAMYVGGAVVAVLLVVGGLWWAGRSDDGDSVVSEPAATADVVGADSTSPESAPADSVAPETAPPETAPPETAPPETASPETAPPETAPPETAPPETAPPETAPPETAPPVAVPAGWRPGEMIVEAQLPPGFDASWAGSPSPIIEPGADLPDGVYWVDYMAQDGVSLQLALGRYESCSVLNDEGACGPGPYGSSAIGREPVAGEITLPLDDTIRVVVEGRECEPVVLEGNGADLAALYTALAADYERAFAAGIGAGGDTYDLMVATRNDPSTGFAAPPAECDDGYSLIWQYAGGPPLFVQRVVDYDTGGPMDPATLLIPTAVELRGDTATVYFFAGFFS